MFAHKYTTLLRPLTRNTRYLYALPKNSLFLTRRDYSKSLLEKRILEGTISPEGKTRDPLSIDPEQIEVFDLEKGNELTTKVQLDLLQSSIDKLAKKNDKLESEVKKLQEMLLIMSTSVHMLGETYVNQRAPYILRNANLAADIRIPFVRANTPEKYVELLKSFVRNSGVRGAEEAIEKSFNRQIFIDIHGLPMNYYEGCQSGTQWITGLLNVSRAGKDKSHISGDVTILGDIDSITKCMHRALRLPILLKRYTQRVYKALNKCSPEESIQGTEKSTVFVITSEVQTDCIPSHFLNRVLNEYEILKLEEHVLNVMEGEVYIPEDKKLIEYIISDPMKDTAGIWRIFVDAEHNGKLYSKMRSSTTKSEFALLLMLRMMYLSKIDLFIGTCLNPLS